MIKIQEMNSQWEDLFDIASVEETEKTFGDVSAVEKPVKFRNTDRYSVRVKYGKHSKGYYESNYDFDTFSEANEFYNYVKNSHNNVSDKSDTFGGYETPMFT